MTALHIVQTSTDHSLLHDPAQKPHESDTPHRQSEYARRLDKRVPGSQLTILVLRNGPAVPSRLIENLRIEQIGGRWPLSLWNLAARLEELQATDPISVVAPQTVFDDAWAAQRFCRRHAIPCVGQIHFDIFSAMARRLELGREPWRTLRWQLAQRLLPRMAAVRVVGSGTGHEILQRGLNANVHVLPVPVTLAASADRHRAVFPAPTNTGERRVLFVGRLVPAKNVSAVLQIAKRLRNVYPDLRFDIVGDGPLRETLAAQSQAWNLSHLVRFHGWVAYNRLSEFYSRATLLLMPSLYEGFGRVALEACRYRLPVVAFRTTGVQDIVIDGHTGHLCEPGDLETLQERTEFWLKARPVTGTESESRDAFAEVLARFSPGELAERWIELLVDTARQSSRTPRRAA